MKPKGMQRTEKRGDEGRDVGMRDLAMAQAFEEIGQEAMDAADRAFEAHVKGRLGIKTARSPEEESSH